MTPEALEEIQARFRQALGRHRVRDEHDRRSVFPDDAQVLADIQWLLDEVEMTRSLALEPFHTGDCHEAIGLCRCGLSRLQWRREDHESRAPRPDDL